MTHDFQRAVIDCLTIIGLAVGALGLSVLLTEWFECLQAQKDTPAVVPPSADSAGQTFEPGFVANRRSQVDG